MAASGFPEVTLIDVDALEGRSPAEVFFTGDENATLTGVPEIPPFDFFFVAGDPCRTVLAGGTRGRFSMMFFVGDDFLDSEVLGLKARGERSMIVFIMIGDDISVRRAMKICVSMKLGAGVRNSVYLNTDVDKTANVYQWSLQ